MKSSKSFDTSPRAIADIAQDIYDEMDSGNDCRVQINEAEHRVEIETDADTIIKTVGVDREDNLAMIAYGLKVGLTAIGVDIVDNWNVET